MHRDMRSAILAAAGAPGRRSADGSILRDFCFDEDFVGFAGHFEGYPILPAVAQMLAAQLLVEELHPHPLRLESVSHAKFLQQLGPGQVLTIACTPRPGTPFCFDTRIRLGDELAASFRLRFAPREPEHG